MSKKENCCPKVSVGGQALIEGIMMQGPKGAAMSVRLPDGTIVEEPLKALSSLPAEHPYSIIGAEQTSAYADQAKKFFEECGIKVNGSSARNSWRITPTGERKPAWLALGDFTPPASKDIKIGDKALIINILGYLDFNTKFLADSFEKNVGFSLDFSTYKNADANSDHKNFPKGVACVACKKAKNGLLYTPYIHTNKDVVADNGNIDFLSKNAIDFVRKMH